MNESDVYKVLEELHIAYKRYEHPPVYTVAEATLHWANIPGQGCKNLFLRDKKGLVHYLIVVADEKRVNLHALSEFLGLSKLSFASPERLMRYLGLEPGSVSPFGLINDDLSEVIVYVDKTLMGEELLTFHPNINTVSLAITPNDFQRFLASLKNQVHFVDIPE
jgi:Ala-tRNA(Pro) deacylase